MKRSESNTGQETATDQARICPIEDPAPVVEGIIRAALDEISYYRNSAKDPKKTVCPADAEVQILLSANAQDSRWELQGAHWHHALWISRERGLSAFRTERTLTISISDPVVFQAYHERKAAARALEGF